MIAVRTAIMENTLWQQMNKNLPKLERQMSPEWKESRSTTCLELEIECYTSVTQDCKVFVEPETAPLGAVPLT